MNWYEEVTKRKDDLLSDLTELLKIDSIKDLSTKEQGKPMGKNIAEALDLMLNKSIKDGFNTTNIDGYIGYAEHASLNNQNYIAVLCHLDVVPATGEWTSPPFEPSIRNGKLYARGAIDDKGPTIAAYYGLKIIKELGLPLKHNVRIIFGTDEESGMSCMKKYVETEPEPLAGFAPDAEFPIIHAEKGQINVKLTQTIESHPTQEDTPYKLISFQAGERGNMVPDVAKAGIEGNTEKLISEFRRYATDNNLEIAIDYQDQQTILTLFGKSAHGMEPDKGVNAGFELGKFLSYFTFNRTSEQFINLIGKKDELYQDYYGHSLQINYNDEVTGPLTVNAGIINYSDKTGGEVHLNIRCPVTTDYQQTIEKLKMNIEKVGFQVTDLRSKEPHHVDQDHPMIKILQQVYHEESKLEPTLLSTGGATYARFMKNGVAFGACFPGKTMTAHQKDEYIEIDDLLKATAIYARSIYELANL